MRARTWFKRILAVAVAALVCAGLLLLRPATAAPDAVAVLDGTAPDPTVPGGSAAPVPLAVSQTRDAIELAPAGSDPVRGFLFYPGGLVDPRAYTKILSPIAAAGYRVVIVKVPFDLPVTDISAAGPVIAAHPEVSWWAVGGHSLGGVASATYAAGNLATVQGLVLWGSYPASDISNLRLPVLSVSGSADGLTTPQDVADSKADLPADATFVVVEGSIHAYFGDYGEQRGDGQPSIPREQAQADIVASTLQWLNTQAAVA